MLNNSLSYSEASLLELSSKKWEPQLIKTITTDSRFFRQPFNMSLKKHSILIDKILGFKILRVEEKLLQRYRKFYADDESDQKNRYDDSETWIGLHPQTLLTPYSEILGILEKVSRFKLTKVIDLGCAYGRIGFVLPAILPNCEFIGYELVTERAREGRRVASTLGMDNFSILEENLLSDDFKLPHASMYFIYDFSRVEDLKLILERLIELIGVHDFILVARGDEVRSLIQMYYPIFLSRHAPIHLKNCSIFITHPETM